MALQKPKRHLLEMGERGKKAEKKKNRKSAI